MYYEIHGTGDPLFLISGFSVDHLAWAQVLKYLEKSYQVIVFDNRGAGQTDVPEGPYSISQLASDTAMLCKQLGFDRAHFVGNSMGGFILQHLAHQYSSLVKSAIISNSTMSIECVFHLYLNAQYQLLKANAPLTPLIQASCCWVYSYPFLKKPGVLDQLIEMILNNPFPFSLTGYAGQYAALDSFDSRSFAPGIHVPVLVIAGDQDLIFDKNSVKALAHIIPSAKYYCFHDCGHLPMIEYPEKFSEIIINFLNDCERGN